ncbi:YciI family protein [Spirillospora sp. CA-294931]|uniref:YciI family protein n=1 Tax=Spirillospora sp. CA-294931 TaxID=3240042 RepID=UPI003D90DB2F
MLMLIDNEKNKDWAQAPEAEIQATMDEHIAFAEYLGKRGTAFSGEALGPTDTATTVRPSPDGLVTTDGPFVELTEFIGGFYIVEAADLDEALEIARHCPMASAIEVRPIWETPEV